MESLQLLINNYLLEKQKTDKEKRNTGKWHPSSFGSCYRKQYWQRANEEESNPIEVRSLRIFQAGHLFHDFVGQFLPKHQCEVKCENDIVLGHADIVTEDTVLDVKTQHSRGFWYMEKSNYDIRQQKKHNWLQVACYATILNKPLVRLVFISKDDLCIAEYGDHTKRWDPEVTMELNTLESYWQPRELPPAFPRLFGVDKQGKPKECMLYCVYRDKCFSIEDERKVSLYAMSQL